MMPPFVIMANKAATLIKHVNKKINVCSVCGKEYQPTYPNASGTFCSSACRKKYKIYEYKCSTCNKIFTRNLATKAINVFCCERCKSKFTNAKAKIKKLKPTNW